MHISKISISNILGIKELTFNAGQFVEVSGRNGQGKTSVLEAVKAALGSGNDATLLRKGEKQGEAVLTFDDGSAARRRVSADKCDNTVRVDGKPIAKPVDWLRKIADLSSVNPVDFLRATKKDRARTLLESMPLVVDLEKLRTIAGLTLKLGDGMHGLAVIDAYRAAVYDERTATNRAVKEKDATINQLRAAMPDAPGGVEGNEDEIRAQIDTLNADAAAETTRIDGKLAGLRETRDADIATIQQQIAELQGQIAKKREDFTATESKANQQRQINAGKLAEKLQPLQVALSGISGNRDAIAKRQATLETIETMDKELGELEKDAETATDALTRIDEFKADMLADLPIPGLEVKDGDIYRDGVQFDRLNTAQQVEIAVEIAKLRAGELKLLAVDGLELLDTEHYEEFKAQILDSGFQLIVARVSDDDFKVYSE